MYEYIAKVVDLGDAELQVLAPYAKLLRKRLKGIGFGELDLKGFRLTHYVLKFKATPDGID